MKNIAHILHGMLLGAAISALFCQLAYMVVILFYIEMGVA